MIGFYQLTDKTESELNCGQKGKDFIMKHIKTLNKANLKDTAKHGGCGECQTSCQSACKTSCTVANQKCEHAE